MQAARPRDPPGQVAEGRHLAPPLTSSPTFSGTDGSPNMKPHSSMWLDHEAIPDCSMPVFASPAQLPRHAVLSPSPQHSLTLQQFVTRSSQACMHAAAGHSGGRCSGPAACIGAAI